MRETIKHEEGYFKGFDHHRLFYQSYKAPRSKAILIIVHGLGEHSGRYQNPVRYFASRGYTLYLYDHRGHGKSDGLRSYVAKFNDYIEDLDSFVQYVQSKEKKKPIFLIAHSMGGQITLNYLAQYETPAKGVITSSPNIEMAVKVPWLKKKLALGASQFLPRLAIPNEVDPAFISRDKEVVRDYKRDPLVSKKITLKLASELIDNVDKVLSLAPLIDLPALMLHAGDDKICAASGSEKFYHSLASDDKTLKLYPGNYHELFNEHDKEEVFKDMHEWLEKRLKIKK